MEEKAWSNLPGRVRRRPRLFLAAILSGQIAGLLFLASWCLVYLAFRREWSWTWPIQVIATFIEGDRALHDPNALTYVLGILVNQLVPALAWSAVFGWVAISRLFVPRLATSLVLGAGVGLLAMGFGVYLIVPPVMAVLHDHNAWWRELPRQWDWILHLAFGLSLGWFFDVLRPRVELVDER